MTRSVWPDFNAIRGSFKTSSGTLTDDPGGEIIYPDVLHPHLVDFVSYDQTDSLQAPHDIVVCCPANLKTNSAVLRYIFREHGSDVIFNLRPMVGNILTLPIATVNGKRHTIHLLITR